MEKNRNKIRRSHIDCHSHQAIHQLTNATTYETKGQRKQPTFTVEATEVDGEKKYKKLSQNAKPIRCLFEWRQSDRSNFMLCDIRKAKKSDQNSNSNVARLETTKCDFLSSLCALLKYKESMNRC